MDVEAQAKTVTPDRAGLPLIILCALSLVVGAITGVVASLFRIVLEHAAQFRNWLIGEAHGFAIWGFLFVVAATALSALVAAWMVRRFAPHAAGSGIPHVEAVLHGEVTPAPFGLGVVKFIGGTLAIGSGLVLGREGPSVQMGAGIAMVMARLSQRKWADCRVLLAAGAGAGLATAFNAPIAGAVFVLEELVQRFEHRIALAALGAAGSAVTVSHMIMGDTPDFQVTAFATPAAGTWPLFLALGLIAGLLAVAYNHTILAALALADAAKRLPVEARAGLVGAVVGAVAWFAPGIVGGGDDISQQILSGQAVLAVIPVVFLLRFALGAASYATGTPGGLFAPMLVLGNQIGFLFGTAARHVTGAALPPEGYAVVGMAAFFAGVVRAPLTGIVLVGEMTDSTALLLPVVFASFAALMMAAMLRATPIYDTLRARTLRLEVRLGGVPANKPAP